ncbi:MAG: nucleoside hydrolase [Steroidobacteraceae bacterium]
MIIDCDPGVDDAVALFLAFAAPRELNLLAVTTVAGNVGPGLTARNARLVRELAGRTDVPVFAGAQRPLVREPVEAGHFHGASGLGTLPVFEPAAPLAPGHAATFIVESLLRAPAGSVTLVVTGPLTNVALALRLEPAIAQRIGAIALMGGARAEAGNITASAEYNIHADPHAAHVVFSCGCPITVLGLDATHQVRSSAARVARLRALGTVPARAVAELCEFSNALEPNLARGGGAPLHDPCPVAWLLRPQLFRSRPCYLQVETCSPLTLGHTAVEFRPRRDGR